MSLGGGRYRIGDGQGKDGRWKTQVRGRNCRKSVIWSAAPCVPQVYSSELTYMNEFFCLFILVCMQSRA